MVIPVIFFTSSIQQPLNYTAIGVGSTVVVAGPGQRGLLATFVAENDFFNSIGHGRRY